MYCRKILNTQSSFLNGAVASSEFSLNIQSIRREHSGVQGNEPSFNDIPRKTRRFRSNSRFESSIVAGVLAVCRRGRRSLMAHFVDLSGALFDTDVRVIVQSDVAGAWCKRRKQ